ncbi:hypothetical protein SAMN05444004_12527 [Jannaschia faecimaris]|uniref:Uncharacterized protein n=1 Tax=Jannaschia faecimaris TaxID=1244108 RepID=A0A1H3U7L9_9RHOB|nr:hypothetical protein SAMN05444004_12527 [Jannaschia faecimaris]
MRAPNVTAARAWAGGYVGSCVKPRADGLLSNASWYERELLQEALGITEDGGAYDVPFIAGHALRERAQTNKAAHSLARMIAGQNEAMGVEVPEPLQDIATGRIPRPKKRGKTGAENGVRDLVFKIMAGHLQRGFSLPLGRNDASPSSRQPASACEIIRDAFREHDLPVPDDRSIEKAIGRCD